MKCSASLHASHRNRMRLRLRDGTAQFLPHEILELLLYRSIPRRNTNDLAHRLLDAYGSLHAVLAQKESHRIPGIGKATVSMLQDTDRALSLLLWQSLCREKPCTTAAWCVFSRYHIRRSAASPLLLLGFAAPAPDGGMRAWRLLSEKRLVFSDPAILAEVVCLYAAEGESVYLAFSAQAAHPLFDTLRNPIYRQALTDILAKQGRFLAAVCQV